MTGPEFFELGLQMSDGLSNVAHIAAWILYFMHYRTSYHLLDLLFQRRHCNLQFFESHNDHT